MPQGLPGDAALTALESVFLTASGAGGLAHSRADIDSAWGASARSGSPTQRQPLGQLSGGQRQLVALADPGARTDAPLLDEPTSALDLRRRSGGTLHVQHLPSRHRSSSFRRRRACIQPPPAADRRSPSSGDGRVKPRTARRVCPKRHRRVYGI